MRRRTRPVGSRGRTEFGDLFTAIRMSEGVSLRELASRLGYAEGGAANIGKYESGQALPPTPEIIILMMGALGYGIDEQETQDVLLAALDDHIRAIHPEFRRS